MGDLEKIVIENPDANFRELEIQGQVYKVKTLTTDLAFEFADLIVACLKSTDMNNPDPAEMVGVLTNPDFRKKTMSLINKSSGITENQIKTWSLSVLIKIVKIMVVDNIDFLSQNSAEDMKEIKSRVERLFVNKDTLQDNASSPMATGSAT